MQNPSLDLMEFIERNILPRYAAFDKAHQMKHVTHVVRASVKLANQLGADVDMAYAIAAYHDLGLEGPRAIHHITSGKILITDARLKKWFSAQKLKLMKEAVEDHRASASHAPRSIYGRIIAEADSIISIGRPGASLRYASETTVAPLACLLALNRFGQQLELGQLDRKGWRSYRLAPMAANIQFVFYRTGTNSTDIVFKVLLNEDEVTLPLKSNMAPYYRWKDFKEYCRQLLGDYGQ